MTFFNQNPSRLATLKNLYMQGAMTLEEYLRFRRIALGINVYKEKIVGARTR